MLNHEYCDELPPNPSHKKIWSFFRCANSVSMNIVMQKYSGIY